MKSIKLQIKLHRLFNLTIAWASAGIFFSLIEFLLISPVSKISNLKNLTLNVYLTSYDFGRSILVNALAGVFASLSIGAFEIFYFQDQFRKKSFSFTVFVKSITYSTAMFTFIIVGLFLDQSFSSSKNIFHPDVVEDVRQYLSGTGVWAFVIYWTAIIILTQIFIQVRDNFGYGVLSNFILGRYHKPKQENRIFMFLDIKSSTTIAEKLGHIKYHNMLNDFFDDINDSIIFSKGEIYQYIGDEISVSWTLKNGVENTNCLNCFFTIVEKIGRENSRYFKKYGIVPEFKTGFHYGEVTVGEVGVIKREIVFTGDVLNTAARIQELCNTYNVKVLISKKLLDLLPIDSIYLPKEIGEITLRGKQTPDKLYTLEKNNTG